ncbi:MAG: hypothetical protein IPP02_06315 [Chitinophagaceae bacterium]|jgi:hypothetical protein|nr:hypothetical protein [Chitinophagaceae bacterium]MBK7679670.1 hypothetical protein [Chitinophagaceae bacterium]MBK8298977.1 hypothetical protein [Chitinophagaceae bacterium]MBK9464799.1 hypothetical protein [Chitinophagaceae bacterium]MBK9659841.1 hypothetical protein [Chitinophagaceae bacterium]
MKKLFIWVLFFISAGTLTVSAQNDSEISKAPQGRIAFKIYNPTEDKTDLFDIQGIGGTTFTVSNTADGSTNSYKHSLQVVIKLIPANKTGNNNFQLNFYSPNENIQQAATYADGTLNIYYPVAIYEDIRTRLEQAFTAKRKVTVKVIQKTNGYREATLVL